MRKYSHYSARVLRAPARLRRNVRRALQHGEPELRLTPLLCNPSRLSLDIGACRGIYAFCMKPYSRGVIAFEPQPKWADFIRRALPGVQVRECAVSDTNAEAELHIPDDVALEGMAYIDSSTRPTIRSSRAVKVKTISIDNLGVGEVGFAKIDVEGLELAVLRGAKQTIARDLPNLLIEAEERHRHRAVESVREFLEPLGYQGWFLSRGALHPIESFSQTASSSTEAGYINNFVFVQRGFWNDHNLRRLAALVKGSG